jgi:hypothetical protein
MKKLMLAFAVAVAAAIPSIALAADSPLSFNASLTSDYRYRGISQSRLKPALQGGVDYALPAGFYIGAWASTIKWIKDWRGDANVGLLQYVYPGAKTTAWDAGFKDPNTTELYGAITFGPATAKVSYALTNLFGNYDFTNNKKSNGSYYLDLGATFEVGAGINLAPHASATKR